MSNIIENYRYTDIIDMLASKIPNMGLRREFIAKMEGAINKIEETFIANNTTRSYIINPDLAIMIPDAFNLMAYETTGSWEDGGIQASLYNEVVEITPCTPYGAQYQIYCQVINNIVDKDSYDPEERINLLFSDTMIEIYNSINLNRYFCSPILGGLKREFYSNIKNLDLAGSKNIADPGSYIARLDVSASLTPWDYTSLSEHSTEIADFLNNTTSTPLDMNGCVDPVTGKFTRKDNNPDIYFLIDLLYYAYLHDIYVKDIDYTNASPSPAPPISKVTKEETNTVVEPVEETQETPIEEVEVAPVEEPQPEPVEETQETPTEEITE